MDAMLYDAELARFDSTPHDRLNARADRDTRQLTRSEIARTDVQQECSDPVRTV